MTETLDCNTIVDTWRGIAGGIRATSTSTLGPLALALAPYGHFKALALALHIRATIISTSSLSNTASWESEMLPLFDYGHVAYI